MPFLLQPFGLLYMCWYSAAITSLFSSAWRFQQYLCDFFFFDDAYKDAILSLQILLSFFWCCTLVNVYMQVIQHGACLGLGLAALGTADEQIYDDIKNVLYGDSAVAGEAAGIGMGLLMAGTGSEKANEMLSYAHDTQHEKIIR